MSEPRLATEVVGDTTVVHFGAKALCESYVAAVRDELFTLADRPRLQLDLSGVEYLGAAALAAFVALHKRMRETGGELTLANLGPVVGEIFDVTHLTKVFDLGPAQA